MRTKISIFPSFTFEAAISAFLDKKKFEIIPAEMHKKGLTEKYSKNLFGEWCYPLKAWLAMYERVVMEKGVTKVIDLSLDICRYPLVMGDISKWIKKDFEYYPVIIKGFSPSLSFSGNIYKQLKKIIPGFNLLKFIFKISLAKKKLSLASYIHKLFYANLPLVRNPKNYKTEFKKFRYEFLETNKYYEKLVENFEEYTKENIVRTKPFFRFLLSGDIAVISMDFPLMDLEVFLAEHEVQIINPGFGPSLYQSRYSKNARKARKIMSKVFSSKHKKAKIKDLHLIETVTLYQILKGISQGVDGLIYLKPNMCSPCENLSSVLKKENYFGLPAVEISYDEHAGVNGIVTRLEAFINIVKEK